MMQNRRSVVQLSLRMESIGIAVSLAVSTSGICSAAMVLDQMGDLSSFDSSGLPSVGPSQVFPDLLGFDSAVLENFEVAEDQLELREVAVLLRAQTGYSSFQHVQGYLLNIFSSANVGQAATGLIGDVASLTLVPGSGVSLTQIIDGSGSHEFGLVKLETNLVLPATGHYWIGVSPIAEFWQAGQFFVQGAPAGVGPGDAWIANPGDGLGAGALFSPGHNYAYSITAVPEPAVPSFWLLGTWWWVSRRWRDRPSPEIS